MPSTLFSSDPTSRALRKALVAFRIDRAKRLNVEPYRIFPNATLELLLSARPETLEELAAVKGMGPKKIKQFGEELLLRLSQTVAESTTVSYDEAPRRAPAAAFKKTLQPAESPRSITVAEYLEHVNDALYEQQATIQAEVSECSVLPSGVYFALKDKHAQAILKCYINPRLYASFGVPLEDGMEVRVGGFPRIYMPNGKFSFQVQALELAGEGSLKKAYELLKKQLEAEGLFARKRPLPQCIERVGIITSRTGAVIGDFRKNLEPLGYRLSLYDARVEGAQAVPTILAALDWFNKRPDRFDVLVVIRGGGSLEDLAAFNNERVARAVFASKIPTLAGIGHDRDVPITSLVADFECSTPSIAAGTVNRSWEPLRRAVAANEQALLHVGDRLLRSASLRLASSSRSLVGTVRRLITRPTALAQQLLSHFGRTLETFRTQLLAYEENLARMNPERNLALGYSILRTASGGVVRSARELAPGDTVHARLAEGSADAKVTATHLGDHNNETHG